MNQERIERIIEMKSNGASMNEICAEMGVTRQRIHQMMDKVGGEPRELFRRISKPLASYECLACEKKFKAAPSKGRKYCSRACSPMLKPRKYDMPEEIRKNPREKARWLYNNVPEYRAKNLENMRRYRERVNADPKKRAHFLKRLRDYKPKKKP